MVIFTAPHAAIENAKNMQAMNALRMLCIIQGQEESIQHSAFSTQPRRHFLLPEKTEAGSFLRIWAAGQGFSQMLSATDLTMPTVLLAQG